MDVDRNRETVLRAFDAFNQRDFATVLELLSEDFVTHVIPEEVNLGNDRQAQVQFQQMNVRAFPDLRMELHQVVAEHDVVATRGRMIGTHQGELMGMPASGNSIDVEVGDFLRLDNDGSIVEYWSIMDTLAFMQQVAAGGAEADD